ncbi:hypothetical protein IV102_28665 [bacterium]|nr:hypothetical protein [bacterium]
MRSRGTSLLEAVLGMAILAILSGLAFSIFSWASTMFALSSVRLELQGEIRRVNSALRRDILGSCYTSVVNHPVTVTVSQHPPDLLPTVNVQRDAICFAALTDIHKPASYDKDVGLCKFDVWTVYCPYTDPTNPNLCKLIRYRVSPHAPSISQLPMADFYGSTSSLWPNPANLVAGSVHTYSDRIRSFAIVPNLGDQTLEVKIALQGKLGHVSTSPRRTTAEIVESSVLLKAENTWPKL